MKALPTQERALRKRNALIRGAIEELSALGFENVTAKSIAARADVATGTFYQYFENKSDILCVIATERFDQLHAQIKFLEVQSLSDLELDEQKPDPKITQLFVKILRFVYDFHASAPELHQVLEQRRALDPELKLIIHEGEAILQQRVLNFVRSFNMPNSQLVAENLFAMGEGIVHRLVFDRVDQSPDKAIEIGAQMLASYFQKS